MKTMLITALLFLAFGCSSGGFGFNDVVSIPPGDKEGTGLSATYVIIHTVRNDGCADVSALDIPPSGTETTFDIDIEVEDGAITFTQIDDTVLLGGIYFDNTFEAGGASILSRGGVDNILRMIRLDGVFQSNSKFIANGESRFQGKIASEDVDCTYAFALEGLEKN